MASGIEIEVVNSDSSPEAEAAQCKHFLQSTAFLQLPKESCFQASTAQEVMVFTSAAQAVMPFISLCIIYFNLI